MIRRGPRQPIPRATGVPDGGARYFRYATGTTELPCRGPGATDAAAGRPARRVIFTVRVSGTARPSSGWLHCARARSAYPVLTGHVGMPRRRRRPTSNAQGPPVGGGRGWFYLFSSRVFFFSLSFLSLPVFFFLSSFFSCYSASRAVRADIIITHTAGRPAGRLAES